MYQIVATFVMSFYGGWIYQIIKKIYKTVVQ